MNASATARSLGFDGQTYYYQSGDTRSMLLDASAMPPLVRAALDRHLQSLGQSPEAMAEGLVMILALAGGSPARGGEILVLGGSTYVPLKLTVLLRAALLAPRRDDDTAPRAAMADEQAAMEAVRRLRVVVRGELPPAARMPEILALPKDAPLAAPEAGYDLCVLFDDGTLDAAGYAHALAAVRPGGQVLCVTARRSMLAAAQAVTKGVLYPITDHIVCWAGKTAKASALHGKRGKHGKRGTHEKEQPARPTFAPLPPLPARVMAFLPYKASMWDSLESIWRAAAADPTTRAYVVPVPFAELGEDGRPRTWKWEGRDLPSDVPAIDWRECELARLRPDAIFIHNPFDGANKVTQVDARFFSPRLKSLTRELVLVPYYVTGGCVHPEGIRYAPGYVTADHVILESEADLPKYLAAYPEPEVPEGKFLTLGSPKYDKVRMDRREDHPLPPDWAERVAGRRVVLYNVTLIDALRHTEECLPKIRWVLGEFAKRDDVVLWWRPHPLLAPTLRSMRPAFAEAYDALVAEYRAAGRGIFDDTPDLHSAIAWADGYYGDYGSVIWLMEATGKPILAQDYAVYEGSTTTPQGPLERAGDPGAHAIRSEQTVGELPSFCQQLQQAKEPPRPTTEALSGTRIYQFVCDELAKGISV